MTSTTTPQAPATWRERAEMFEARAIALHQRFEGHAAELRGAIAQTRIVFESEPAASDVLNYLQAVMDAAPAGALAQTSEADQAAAMMRAESAQMVADAERSVDARKIASPPAPLVALSKEVFTLSNKLMQPADLTAQLLVLAELRGLRADLSPAVVCSRLALS